MDNPIGGSNEGTKNTTDPRSNDTIQEGPGAVASDSLAAESVREGGGFSENRDAEPLGVSGSNSTFNTTDTSGATKLEPASDASKRGEKDESSTADYTSSGQGSGGNTITGSSGGRSDKPYQSNYLDQGEGEEKPFQNADVAPSYVSEVTKDRSGKPHGKNIQEGGFEGEANTTLDDDNTVRPADFLKSEVPGSGPRQSKEDTGNDRYEALDSETSA